MPFLKLRLKKAYSNGFMPELKYVTRNVKGVSNALKFESPRYERDLKYNKKREMKIEKLYTKQICKEFNLV